MPIDIAAPRAVIAVYDEHGIPHSEFKRVCLRCHRPMLGYGYQTFYGVFVYANGKRIPASGEPLHDVCPDADTKPRATPHNADEFWGEEHTAPKRKYKRRTERRVEENIQVLHNGRFAVRIAKKRLGTYETLEQARAARANYLQQRSKEQEKRNGKPMHTRREHKHAKRQTGGHPVRK